MSGGIDYASLMYRAMRRLIRDVLNDVAKHGLPGDHHFFIVFDTGHPGASVSNWLAERHPERMTIVMQHWFENLDVGEDGFSVTLNFGGQAEPVHIPYDSIVSFADPSVEFGLRFENRKDVDAGEEEDATEAPADRDTRDEGDPGQAQVVRLDSFRK